MTVSVSSGIPRDFTDDAARQRLASTAWKFFGRLAEIWAVPEKETLQLLGMQPGTKFNELDETQLGAEQLLRISYLAGICKALRILYRGALADQWVRLPNTNEMFGGQPPLAYMVHGGIGALRQVRKLLDARCEGN